MRQAKSFSDPRVEQHYIFYVCLALVLVIAAIGVAMDAAGR